MGEYMVRKHTHGIKIVIPVKHSYLVGLSRCKNLSIPELLFGSIPFYTMLILGRSLPTYEGFCMVYRP